MRCEGTTRGHSYPASALAKESGENLLSGRADGEAHCHHGGYHETHPESSSNTTLLYTNAGDKLEALQARGSPE
jgi:hypothetical protein